jgi:hypothetical protein
MLGIYAAVISPILECLGHHRIMARYNRGYVRLGADAGLKAKIHFRLIQCQNHDDLKYIFNHF